MSGPASVLALVLFEWSVGWVGAAAWTQSWGVVRRGHFRILAWAALLLSAGALVAFRSVVGPAGELEVTLAFVFLGGVVAYLAVQYSHTDVPGTIVGASAALVGATALALSGDLIGGWPAAIAGLELLSGAALLGAVSNGMLLGHWYLNQPGLKPWALGRLTQLALVATAASALLGLATANRLSNAVTEGAVLGLPGFGADFGFVFYLIWLMFVLFTGVVVYAARRCVNIRSIQSATGLYYVALLTAGIAEFLVRYLMINA